MISQYNDSTWTKVGNTITSNSTTLQTATFYINKLSSIRLRIRKLSGGSARINIDDIQINAYAGATPTYGDGDHMAMGNPSNATANVAKEKNDLMRKTYYALSYNRSKACPNRVS